MNLSILPISTESPRFADFVELPWRIYPGKHRWVPPLRASLYQELSPENRFFTHGEAQCFLCLRGEEVVGRIVASVDHALADQAIGHFGYFEAIDDREVVAALLATAEDWVRQRGKTTIHGPIDLTIFNRYRIQTEGFDREPFYGEPRSPRYYSSLLEACGYRTHLHWRSWDIPRWKFYPMRLVYWLKAKAYPDVWQRYNVAFFDMDDFASEIRAMHPLLLATFEKNYGFSRISLEEHMHLYEGANRVLCPEISFKGTDQNGNLMGFAYTYRDPADAFAMANGDANRLDWSTPSDTLILYSFGIRKEHRKTGLIAVGFDRSFSSMLRLGFKRAIGALAKEGPTVFDKLGPPSRRCVVFAKGLL